jgi:hypothetical protein
MDRKVLLITNPGEQGAKNYCDGVNRDIENYSEFLSSPIGGAWDAKNEFVHLHRPDVTAVRKELSSLNSSEYSLVIFCGHGEYSSKNDTTILELRSGQEIDSKEMHCGSSRRTLLIDCCRKKAPTLKLEDMMRKMATASFQEFDADKSKRCYNNEILRCSVGLVIGYACKIGEEASDDEERGGVYSYNLIKSARKWATTKDVSTLRMNNQYSSFSIVDAHSSIVNTVATLTNNAQHPSITKPRSEPYFPFAIAV